MFHALNRFFHNCDPHPRLLQARLVSESSFSLKLRQWSEIHSHNFWQVTFFSQHSQKTTCLILKNTKTTLRHPLLSGTTDPVRGRSFVARGRGAQHRRPRENNASLTSTRPRRSRQTARSYGDPWRGRIIDGAIRIPEVIVGASPLLDTRSMKEAPLRGATDPMFLHHLLI